MQQAGLPFPRTHDLEQLLDLLLPLEPNWAVLRPALQLLTTYSVQLRYPGVSADRDMAREAVSNVREVQVVVRSALGLPM